MKFSKLCSVFVLIILVIIPLINSFGCNYEIQGASYSDEYGKARISGQCKLGITEYILKYDSGIFVNIKAFSYFGYDRVIYFGVERKVLERGSDVDRSMKYLSIPIFYSVKLIKVNNILLVQSPAPNARVRGYLIKGYISTWDYIKSII